MSTAFLDTLFSLRGKVALVSGASRGIGLAIARGLTAAGADVIGIGRSSAPVVWDTKEKWRYRTCDITDDMRFRDLCEELFKVYGRLNVYVHAAGMSLPLTEDIDPCENFDKTIDVNLKAVYHCALAVAECMSRSGGGTIIHITSIGSVLGFPNNPGYVASKGGLRLLTRALALDLVEKNIRVNNIAPGYIHTAMTDQSYRDPTRHEERLRRMMIKRWGRPEDIVGTAIFLASEASAYITGQDIFVDGGWIAKGL